MKEKKELTTEEKKLIKKQKFLNAQKLRHNKEAASKAVNRKERTKRYQKELAERAKTFGGNEMFGRLEAFYGQNEKQKKQAIDINSITKENVAEVAAQVAEELGEKELG